MALLPMHQALNGPLVWIFQIQTNDRIWLFGWRNEANHTRRFDTASGFYQDAGASHGFGHSSVGE